MRGRAAVAGNVLKAWLLFAVPALAMGFVGWRLGGYRLALLFIGSIVLLAAALYWYADRIAMGMVGGLMGLQEDAIRTGVRPAWIGYVGVDDVDTTADRIKNLGCTVHVPPQDIVYASRFSVVSDPQMAT